MRCFGSASVLATTPDGEWLSSTDDDVKALQRREVPASIEKLMQKEGGTEMDEHFEVSDYFDEQFASGDHHIHVLVDIPENPYAGVPYYSTRAGSREDAFCSLSTLWSILTPLLSVGQDQEKEKAA